MSGLECTLSLDLRLSGDVGDVVALLPGLLGQLPAVEPDCALSLTLGSGVTVGTLLLESVERSPALGHDCDLTLCGAGDVVELLAGVVLVLVLPSV